jgi:hypothetical protein
MYPIIMFHLTVFVLCAFVYPHFSHADTCSSVASLGYINVTYALNLAYIEEQTQYCPHHALLFSLLA